MPTLTGYGSVNPGCLLSPHRDENCDLAMTSSPKIVHTDLDTSTRKDLFVPMAKIINKLVNFFGRKRQFIKCKLPYSNIATIDDNLPK